MVDKYMPAFLLCLSLAFALVLEACNGEGISSAERIISSGWADVSNEDTENQEPLYCYKTIGSIDCYKTPDPKRHKQLVSTYPPKSTARPVGLGKVLASFTQEKVDRDGINEKELDKARYEPSPSEQAAERAQEDAWQAKDAERQARTPLTIK